MSGVREHAFFMKHMSDAVAIRDRAVELLELANAIDDVEEGLERISGSLHGSTLQQRDTRRCGSGCPAYQT